MTATTSKMLTGWLCLGAILAFLSGLPGCRRFDVDAYKQLVKSGISSIPYAADMDVMFDDVDHFVTSPVSNKPTRTWNSQAFLHGRYIFTLQIEVSVEGTEVVGLGGEPQFFIEEVDKVTDNNGIPGIRMNLFTQRHFGREEWKRIVAAGGDFGAAGITLIKDKPVPDFEVWRNAVGRDRIHVRGDSAPRQPRN